MSSIGGKRSQERLREQVLRLRFLLERAYDDALAIAEAQAVVEEIVQATDPVPCEAAINLLETIDDPVVPEGNTTPWGLPGSDPRGQREEESRSKPSNGCVICCDENASDMVLTLCCGQDFCSACASRLRVGRKTTPRAKVKCPYCMKPTSLVGQTV